MALTNTTKKLLHLKVWETLNPLPTNFVAGSFLVSDKTGTHPHRHQTCYAVFGASAVYSYNIEEDAWVLLPASGIAGAGGAGSCGAYHPKGMLGGSVTSTASAGTTTTATTTRTITRSITGCKIRCVGGTNVGYESTILRNTTGANAILTFADAAGVAFDATSVFEIFSGSLWYFNGGATIGFRVYDVATNAWSAKSVTGLPASFATSGRLTQTPAADGAFFTGTATGGTSTTLVTGSAWTADVWKNYQLRITGGTGKGQTRVVSANTATTLTVSAAWTVTPDATSTYSIEGNSDALYLMGNNAVTLYKYSISGDTWATLAPTAARAGAPGGGLMTAWIDSAGGDWNSNGVPTSMGQGMFRQNGRYILSFRGAAGNVLDAYDIAANTWISGLSYGNQLETFTVGSSAADRGGNIYISKEATGRLFVFSVEDWELRAWSTQVYTATGAAVEGDRMTILPYVDGASVVPFVYTATNTSNALFRAFDIGVSS